MISEKHYDFIEIGTSDFDTLIQSCSQDAIGLSIEPLKFYLDKLANKDNVKKMQVAISDEDGEIDIYYIKEDKIISHSLPWWVRGSNSIGKPHPFTVKEIGEELYNALVTIEKIPTLSWNTLVTQESIGSIDFLKIDTEGFDHIILKDYYFACKKKPKLFAKKIKFERHPEVSNLQGIDEIISLFSDYYVEIQGTDVTLTKVKIPRIIHQTYKTINLPKEISSVVDELKLQNPEFEYRFYDDNDCINFIRDNYDEETLELYNSINPIYGSCKSDFFRYLVIYKCGGVYLDIKSKTTTPLRKTILPTDEYLLTHWPGRDWNQELNYYHGEFQNWHIISIPGHVFLKKSIELVKNNIKNYNGEVGKKAVLNLSGPITYSKAILENLKFLKTNAWNSPIREFKLENEIGLQYKGTAEHHNSLLGKSWSETEPLILLKQQSNDKQKIDRAFVYYCNENYLNIVNTSIKILRKYSDIRVYVYLVNCTYKFESDNVIPILWNVDLEDFEDNMYHQKQENFYIKREDKRFYKLLIQRPLIVKHCLENFAKEVAYLDSDTVPMPWVNKFFEHFNFESEIPYFTECFFDYLATNGVASLPNEDYSNTIEHNVCKLLDIDQSVRKWYRQTGYFISGQNCIPFLNEWYSLCVHEKIVENPEFYAPFHEETIMNVLMWKMKNFSGLHLVYVNANLENIDKIFNEVKYNGHKQFLGSWLAVPGKLRDIYFIHGEKNSNRMEQISEIIDSNVNNTLKILFLSPHLSTGGMPGFLLKRIQTLLSVCPELEIYVVEYQNLSDDYVVQKNQIKQLIPSTHFYTLGQNKLELIDIIKNKGINIVHIDDMVESLNFDQSIQSDLINELYSNDRTWRVIETCHNVSFQPQLNKIFNPDAYSFCSPWHSEKSFSMMPSYSELIEFPIDNSFTTLERKKELLIELGLDPNKKHIVNVGLWTPGKNQREGLKIAKILEKTNPEIQFHFIGNLAPNFEKYWGSLIKKVPSNVTIWGERSDASLFIEACDIFMFNSTWECNPLVLREAISYGKKIIARNLKEYLGIFDEYITSINDDVNQTTIKIIELLDKEVTYNVVDGQSEFFAKKHLSLYKKVLNQPITTHTLKSSNVQITNHFIENPFLEIRGESKSDFLVKFFDENEVCQYENKIASNHWVRLSRKFYTKWKVKVWENQSLIYERNLDYKNQRVYIAFDSKSLGDTIAWIPYALEFQKKHECKVIVSTFWNSLFEDVYPELEFIKPGQVAHGILGMYKLGWFYDGNYEKEAPNTIPLQKSATNILGLEYTEIKPKIAFEQTNRPIEEKYVTIATNSTAGLKFWTREGWQELVNYLNNQGYKVINVSKEDNPLRGVQKLKDTSIETTIDYIYHSEFFIGLSSGLSWLAWGLGKNVVMISNFTEENHEFTSNCIRITNKSVCNSCWNKPEFKFDRGDWNWCPLHKNTPRQFECHTSIKSSDVIEKIQSLI
jgi:autotransporter strand-loop-strand O-heptosyltransferase